MHNPLIDIQADFEINRPVELDIKLPQKKIISTDDRRTDRDKQTDRQTDGQTSRTTTIVSFFEKIK